MKLRFISMDQEALWPHHSPELLVIVSKQRGWVHLSCCAGRCPLQAGAGSASRLFSFHLVLFRVKKRGSSGIIIKADIKGQHFPQDGNKFM